MAVNIKMKRAELVKLLHSPKVEDVETAFEFLAAPIGYRHKKLKAEYLKLHNTFFNTGLKRIEVPHVVQLNQVRLNIGHDQLAALPPEIHHLEHLEVLAIQASADLNELPENMMRLPSLRELWLDGCLFEEFPHVLTSMEMSSLERIDLSENAIRALDALKNLKWERGLAKLRVLELASNEITEVPAEIEYLKNLKQLDLSENPIPSEDHNTIRSLVPGCTVTF